MEGESPNCSLPCFDSVKTGRNFSLSTIDNQKKRVAGGEQEKNITSGAHVNEALKGGHVRILAVDNGGDDVAPFQLLGRQIVRDGRQRRRLVATLEQGTQSGTSWSQSQSGHDLVFFQQLGQR